MSLLEIQTLLYFCHPEHTESYQPAQVAHVGMMKTGLFCPNASPQQRYLAALQTTLYIVTRNNSIHCDT